MKNAQFRNLVSRILPKDPIWRLMVVNWLQGMAVGLVLAGVLLSFDIAHLRTLMIQSNSLMIASVLLVGGFSLSFGALMCGTAIMTLGDTSPDDLPRDDLPRDDLPRGGKMIPIRVVARRARG